MKFGDYVAYAAVCTVTKEPKFDIKKTIVGKKTRAFIVTLRNIKQDLTPELIDAVYLKGTRTDEELYAKLVLPVVEEAAKSVEVSTETETPAEVHTEAEVVKPTETTEPTKVETPVVEATEESVAVDTPTNTKKEE